MKIVDFLEVMLPKISLQEIYYFHTQLQLPFFTIHTHLLCLFIFGSKTSRNLLLSSPTTVTPFYYTQTFSIYSRNNGNTFWQHFQKIYHFHPQLQLPFFTIHTPSLYIPGIMEILFGNTSETVLKNCVKRYWFLNGLHFSLKI